MVIYFGPPHHPEGGDLLLLLLLRRPALLLAALLAAAAMLLLPFATFQVLAHILEWHQLISTTWCLGEKSQDFFPHPPTPLHIIRTRFCK